AYTAGGAEATGEKHVKGKLKAGYYADFIVLDTDIFSSPPAALLDAKVVMTVVGGKIVYRNSG
ncbi:MAG: amidohydrolase family protein, partial [Bacilli bacterium]